LLVAIAIGQVGVSISGEGMVLRLSNSYFCAGEFRGTATKLDLGPWIS